MKKERGRGGVLLELVRYRLPAALWTSLLLLMSTAAGSAHRTHSGLAGLIFWLFGQQPSIPTLEIMNVLLRKAAHVVAYGIEAALMLRAVRNGRPGLAPGWIAWAVALTLLVAAVDELNQSRTAGRGGHPSDVLLDMCGAAIAMLVARARIRT